MCKNKIVHEMFGEDGEVVQAAVLQKTLVDGAMEGGDDCTKQAQVPLCQDPEKMSGEPGHSRQRGEGESRHGQARDQQFDDCLAKQHLHQPLTALSGGFPARPARSARCLPCVALFFRPRCKSVRVNFHHTGPHTFEPVM